MALVIILFNIRFPPTLPPDLVKLGLGDIIEIEKIIVHPQFDPSSNDHDIALIRLKRVVEFNKDHQLPSCLWRDP